MMRPLLLTSFIAVTIFFSCTNVEEEDEVHIQEQEKVIPQTLLEHLIFTTDYILSHPFSQGESVGNVSKYFNINNSGITLTDTLELESGQLQRQFFFENEKLVAIKLSSFSDSIQMGSEQSNLSATIQSISEMIGAPVSTTLYSTSWKTASIAFKLKIFPTEGIDYIIFKDDNVEPTQCVGDFFAAKGTFEKILEQRIKGVADLSEDSSDLQFQGITLKEDTHQNEIEIVYDCPVSEKLIIIDAKSIINSINQITGLTPQIKDNIYFWVSNTYEIQLSQLKTGHFVKFINKQD